MARNVGNAARLALTAMVAVSLTQAQVTRIGPVPPGEQKIVTALTHRMDAEAGPYRVWVFFADKGVTNKADRDLRIAELERTYNRRAIERRRLRAENDKRGGALFDERDFPLVSSYVDAVNATGAALRVESTWLNAVSVEANTDQIDALATLPFVTKVQPVARWRRNEPLSVKPAKLPEGGVTTRALIDHGASTAQLNQINVIKMHDDGYTGAGVVVGILDTGFRQTHVAFQDPVHPLTVLAQYDFVDNDPNPAPEPGDASDQHDHGTLILGTLASYAPGSLVGGAFDASYILCKTEDKAAEYPGEEDNYVAGLQFAEANGVDMTTSSLGYIDWYTQADLDGLTAVTTIAMNTMNDNGVHSCNAAGNEYHDTNPATSSLIAPADAFRVITCGAVGSGGAIASFSSEGPTADGRVKPEVLALGLSTQTISAYSDTGYSTADGTSLSTPLVAGAVACLIQAHPEWTVDELRAALFASASESVATGTFDPLYVRGYGIVNAWGAIQDCNGNGTPDVVDIANGEPDCNGDGVPNSCELASGAAQDCNDNGVPDLCDITPPGLTITDLEPAAIGWQPINATGTALGLSDDGETTVSMGFTNPVFASGNVSIDNNGGVGFVSGASLDYTNEPLPSSAAFGGAQALLPLWDDLDADTGNVYYETIGTAPNRTFIVQWQDRPHFSGDSVLDGNETTFQIQVFESPVGGIHAQYLYKDTDFQDIQYNNGASATIGYQGGDGTADQWSYNAGSIDSSTVLSLAPSGAAGSQDTNGNGIPDECEGVACSPADITTQGAGSGDPGYGVPDGAVSAADLNYFVNAYVAGDLATADITTQGAGAGDPGYGTPDGLLSAADINYYVNLWVAGCP